jgi:hypothetical protein
VPTTGTTPPSSERIAERVTVNGRPGVLVKKTFDSGSYLYGGALNKLLVDEVAHENFQILDGDPLSATGFTTHPRSSAATGKSRRSPAPGSGPRRSRPVSSYSATTPAPGPSLATNSSRRSTLRARFRASGCESFLSGRFVIDKGCGGKDTDAPRIAYWHRDEP